jgi:tRNA-splicing ligase RtcB
MNDFNVITTEKVPIKMWTKGVQAEVGAQAQLKNLANLPFIYKWVAAMPDMHFGLGATIGSVIATDKAIIPAAVGVDLGCGMMAVRTSLMDVDLPGGLAHIRNAIEKAVPHGRTDNGGKNDRGGWGNIPGQIGSQWEFNLADKFKKICEKHPQIAKSNNVKHLGTLGTGNHFIEVCLDEEGRVWFMLHSGSRGVGGRIGQYFIRLAKEEMNQYFINLPDMNLAYLPQGTKYFKDYVEAVNWAQNYALINREIMMENTLEAIKKCIKKKFRADDLIVNCHHNYVQMENHYGRNVWVTRKGAVRARKSDWGIIPGSMGTKSFIVRGKGNLESFTSCSHGAGRAMSRKAAKEMFSVEDHKKATEGVECRKDASVIDETPGSYKPIDDVMNAQKDLVEVVHTLKQVLCVKG